MRILVVDDEKQICDGMVRRLRSAGMNCVEEAAGAYSAEQALEMLRVGRWDMMFSDIRMDGMDGITLIREAKKLRPELIIVIITAFGRFDYAQQAIRLGVQDFLVKPCTARAMLDQVEKARDLLCARGGSILSEEPGDFLDQVEEYCRRHLADHLDMAAVANHFGVSYTHFSRRFHEQAGIPFSQFVIRMKIGEVQRRMLRGERLVQVAESLGYLNANNLTRAFTREVGISPSQWLEQTRTHREEQG